MLTISNHLQTRNIDNCGITFRNIKVYSSNSSINIERTYSLGRDQCFQLLSCVLTGVNYRIHIDMGDGL